MKTYIGKCILLVLLALISYPADGQSSETPLQAKGIIHNQTTKGVQIAENENALPVRQIYKDMEKKLKSIVSSTIKMGMPFVMREVYSRNLSSLCLTSLLQLTGALRQTKLWAFQMLDASGKVPIGFLAGTLTSLGNYEECVGIDINKQQFKMKGQYCVVEIIPPLPKWRPYMSLHLPVPELRNLSAPDTVTRFLSSFVHNFYIVSIKTGLCTPATCSREDIDKLLQIIPEKLGITWKFNVKGCETQLSFEFSSIQMFLVYFFILIVIVVVIASATDLVLEQEFMEKKDTKGMILRILRCFALRFNMRVISGYMGPEERLRFVYGFTFISVLWAVAANIFMYVNYDISANFMEALEMTRNLFYQMLTSKIYPYQTLFFLGAFVTTYRWMKSPEQKLCIWKYIFAAYWRYTPSYMLMIGLLMLTPGWGSGPSWMSYMTPTYENCKANWWTNMLYISNYVHTDHMCLRHSWFLSVGAQLHVIGLLVLIPLKRRPKVGLLLNLFLAIGSLLTVFLANMYNGTPPNEIISFLNKKDRLYYAGQTYYHPYYHLMIYCSGIFAGYLVATKPLMNIPPKLSYFLWVVTGGMSIVTVSLVTLWSEGIMPNPVVSASYDALSKLVWASFLFWAAVSCATEQKGICYDVTSWGCFPFLSRLMFGIIVLNPSIVTMVFGFKRAHIFVSHFEIFYNLGTLMVCNVIVAYAFHVVIESPLLQLTQLLKRTCGIKTFNSSSSASSICKMHQCEEVITEKLPKTKPQNDTKENQLKRRISH